MTRHGLMVSLIATLTLGGWTGRSPADDAASGKDGKVVAPASERFAADGDEVPDMRRHVVPLLGRVGCNGRACHGSFQGRGGFRLSLFGYDFEADRKAMLASGDEGENRVNLEQPAESLLLKKPTLDVDHEGGKRFSKGSWQYRLLHKWIAGGARGVADDAPEFSHLEVTPAEIVFQEAGEKVQLEVVVQWSDGSREDVTCLCRFKSNSDQVAEVDEDGLVTAKEPGDTHVVAFYDNGVQPVPVIQPVTDQAGDNYPDVATPTRIDELVVQKLRKLGIVPSELSSDAEFLRRASLDITGTLPAPGEVEAFLADTSADKRARKIDELLERPGYAAWWATRLCDITGNNDDTLNNVTPVRQAASQQWYDWIRKRVTENTPYDELAAGIVLATSREEGEDFKAFSKAMSGLYQDSSDAKFANRSSMPHYWARRTFRDPKDRAISFAYTFMGIRIQCAQCHKHPFDQWTKQDFEDFTGFFSGINFGTDPRSRDEYDALLKELNVEGRGNQIRNRLRDLLQEGKTVPFQEVYVMAPRRNTGNARNRGRGGRGRVESARLLGGEKLDLNQFDDPREPLMAWLREKNNRFFARAFVNRVWAGYFNVGIVEPPDDLSLANPPSNKRLLDYLTDEFVERGFNMKWLHREIANSHTYQRSWRPNDTNKLDERNFSRAVPRRMPAEVAYDALQLATSSDDEFRQKVADVEGRAIAIPGAGRRGQAARNGPGYALTIFGRSVRESNCDCDRSSEASLLQTVFLHNDQEVFAMIDRRRGGWMNDVAQQLGVTNRPVAAQPNAAGQRQLQAVRQQLARARRQNNKELVQRLQRRLRALQERLGTNSPAGGPATAEKVAMDPTPLVQQAYLRTLSRLPSDEEVARCREYIEDADDTLNGVRGVLWALLNTKEFIVNH